jgi:hypothetical protein
MKSRRLTETDLANMAFLPRDVKRLKLIALIKPKKIQGSYEPFRSTAGDAVNQQFPFFDEEQDATPLGKLEEVVAKACRGDGELLAMNLAVARATHEFASKVELTAERADIRPITLAFGHAYHFGMPLIMRYGGVAYAAFPDLRRTGPLSVAGCRFVFSMMHQRWRVNYPDLAELRLAIWRYLNNSDRTVREIPCLDSSLIPYADLMADVTDTYDILHTIMKEQESERRRSGGGAGPLFGT